MFSILNEIKVNSPQ
ncbi:unnamed protein product, partial [Diplocarpon coronariae]